MSNMRRKHGFWVAAGRLKLRSLLTIEFFVGLVGGAVLAWLQLAEGSVGTRTDVAGDLLSISAAILGVVFAGFSLLVAFLSGNYLRFLNTSDEGVGVFFHPFLLAIGVQVAVVLGSVMYRGMAPFLPTVVEGIVFVGLCVSFGVALMDVVALGRLVLMQASLRALHDDVNAQDGNVRPIKKAGNDQ